MSIALRKSDPPASPLTIAEFDDFVAAQADDTLYELVDGEIVMMSNPTETHEQIASNIGAPLKIAMDGRKCRTYFGGMRLQRSADARATDKPWPDVVVRCGAAGTGTYITDPLVVVEVLSPSTIDVDRGRKLEFYKSLPTLRHVALVYQGQTRVEHYSRSETGWQLDVLTTADAKLTFEAVDFSISLDKIYFGVPA
jgi:Uma2 family endonuclease